MQANGEDRSIAVHTSEDVDQGGLILLRHGVTHHNQVEVGIILAVLHCRRDLRGGGHVEACFFQQHLSRTKKHLVIRDAQDSFLCWAAHTSPQWNGIITRVATLLPDSTQKMNFNSAVM